MRASCVQSRVPDQETRRSPVCIASLGESNGGGSPAVLRASGETDRGMGAERGRPTARTCGVGGQILNLWGRPAGCALGDRSRGRVPTTGDLASAPEAAALFGSGPQLIWDNLVDECPLTVGVTRSYKIPRSDPRGPWDWGEGPCSLATPTRQTDPYPYSAFLSLLLSDFPVCPKPAGSPIARARPA